MLVVLGFFFVQTYEDGYVFLRVLGVVGSVWESALRLM